MTVSFENIPSDILTPAHLVEIDNTGAVEQSGIRPHKVLLHGYRFNGGAVPDSASITLPDGSTDTNFPTGSIAENTVKRIASAADAEGYFGAGSQLARMCAAYLAIDDRTPLYAVASNPAAGTAATGTVTFTASSPAAGTVNVYIAGKRYQIPVTTSSTNASLAAELTKQVNEDWDCPVTASISLGVVTLTARHSGPEGNDVDVRVSYRDTDALPSGVGAAVVAMSGGATSIDVDAVRAVLGGTQYDTIISGIADAANLAKWEEELETRWGPTVDIDGQLIVGFNGDFTASYNFTLAPARNSKQSTVVFGGLTPTPPWIVASVVGARDVRQTIDDPARGRHTLWCKGVLAPEASDRFDQAERDQLLHVGGSTLKVDGGGNVIIEALNTTYQLNAQGAVDASFRDLSTKRTVSYLRWSWRTRMQSKFPRHKLANDGTDFDAGQAIVTPNIIRGEAVAWFTAMENAGLVEDLAQFREDLVVERSTSDFNRIDAILRPNILNKFVVSATKLQFRV